MLQTVRMKTEQLPLETIPHDSQTCILLITVTADVGRVAQLLTKVSRFDPWLVDGRLRGGFDRGAGGMSSFGLAPLRGDLGPLPLLIRRKCRPRFVVPATKSFGL
jgi:hypothetical protein